tara:strand:- start:1164 stop:1316 length:153 start_codon:yes stop_codon:yes gene_type:complete
MANMVRKRTAWGLAPRDFEAFEAETVVSSKPIEVFAGSETVKHARLMLWG